MRERVFGVVRAREGGRASARGRVGFADEKAVFALEETSWNELETSKILRVIRSYTYKYQHRLRLPY